MSAPALGAVIVCARCGETLPRVTERCTTCTGLVAHSVLADVEVGPLESGAVPASRARRAISLGASIALPLLVAGVVGLTSAPLGALVAALLAGAVFLTLAVVELIVWLLRGRSFGSLVTSTRTVRADDGTVLSWRGLARPFSQRMRGAPAAGVEQGPVGRLFGSTTVVLSPGQDPLLVVARGVATLPPRIPGAVARAALPHVVMLTFDGRARIPLVRSAVLGRNPQATGGDVVAVALPDMSRSISKAHVRLDRDGASLYAQDLGSTNGTQLVEGDRVVDLREGERVEIPPGAHLLLAGIPLRLDVRDLRDVRDTREASAIA